MSRCLALAASAALALLTPYAGIRLVSAAPLSNQVLEGINQPKSESTAPASSNSARSIKSISGALSNLSPPTPIAAPTDPSALSAPVTLPYLLLSQMNQQALIPDWSRISFTSFRFTTAGSLSSAAISRQWSPGQTLDQVMTLGDFQDSLNLEGLNLLAVNKAVGRALDGTPSTTTEAAVPPLMLSDFKLMSQQTIGSLIQAHPDLKKLPASQVSVIADLLRPIEGNATLAENTVGELLTAESNLAALRFDSLDLSKYKVSDIPGLERVPFQALKDWQQASIDDIPGLKDMPWSAFPTPPNQRGVIGKVSISEASTGTADSTAHPISGSDVAGDVNCTQSTTCSHIDLGGFSSLQGAQWFSAAQLVDGGAGALSDVNGGKESTGRSIYGEAFKVVLDSIGKTDAHSSVYFHACQSQPGQTLISCSPYVIGPVAFMSYADGDDVFLGALNWVMPVSAHQIHQPQTVAQPIPSAAPLVVDLTHSGKTRKPLILLIVLVSLVGGGAYLCLITWRKPKSPAPTPQEVQREHP